MESSTRTEQFEPAVEPSSTDAANAGFHPSMIAPIREQCSACGAAMASDQRYCVECGQRRGPARVASLDGLAQRSREAPTARRPPQRARMSINSTAIAGIGTLLLAMGVGVLIGRSGNSTSAKAPPAQVVTVAGPGGTAGAATAATPQSPSGNNSAKSSGTSAATTAKSTSKSTAKSTSTSASKTPAAAPTKAVTVGSKGSGPGYQHGHFTGNFFGEGGK
jgi:hypothetical protein